MEIASNPDPLTAANSAVGGPSNISQGNSGPIMGIRGAKDVHIFHYYLIKVISLTGTLSSLYCHVKSSNKYLKISNFAIAFINSCLLVSINKKGSVDYEDLIGYTLAIVDLVAIKSAIVNWRATRSFHDKVSYCSAAVIHALNLIQKMSSHFPEISHKWQRSTAWTTFTHVVTLVTVLGQMNIKLTSR